MAKSHTVSFNLTAANLLHSLRWRGGSAPLHTVGFSRGVIQYLLDQKLVKTIQNYQFKVAILGGLSPELINPK